MVGIVFSSYEFVNFIATPVFGNFVSEIGAKFMYAVGISVAGTCSVLFGFLDQGPGGLTFIAMSLLVRIVEALGMSAFSTSSFAIISAEFPNHISSVFSVLETFIGIGLLVGPTIGGSLYELGGFGLPFWVTGVLIMATGILFFGCLPPPMEAPRRRQGHILSLLRSPLVWVAMFLSTAGASSLGFMDPTLALHLDQFGLSTIEVSLFFVIAPLLHALLAPLWGYLSDTRDIQAPMLMWACVACGAGFLMVGPTPLLPFLPKQIWFITMGLVVYGLGIGCTIIPTMKCIVMGARELGFADNISTFGMVSGLFNATFHFGAFLGPTIAGALVEQIGFEYSATVIAAIFAVGFCVTSCFFGFRRWRTERGGYPYISLADGSRKQHGGSSYSRAPIPQKQQQFTSSTSETTPLLENDGKSSVSCQTPQTGRFLQSSTFSSSGHMSW
ncbi:hypothetical protein RRG08_066630 [Elysia crispata]|uniref:Major facilitator superfamily (MFS) profile domain-containing protein n=1 Tax=Elysia crispata TaxID=231223 RepID=A0AAE1D234_9GAST|nr:hypothetical protein RRG08_066630 [Elysia crispata]